MLINFSHTNSINWPHGQLQSAIDNYNKIVDLPAPPISPAYLLSEVKDLVENYFEKVTGILEFSEDKENAVIVENESTFLFLFIEKLKENNIPAITPCYLLVKKDNEFGIKEFVKFRSYY